MKRISLLFIISCFAIALNLICYFIIDDPVFCMWMGTIIGIIQTVLLLIVTKELNPLNLFSLTMLMWAATYLIPALLVVAAGLPIQYNLTHENLSFTLILVNISQVLVAFIWKVPDWTRLAIKIPRPGFPSIEEITGPLGVLWGAYLVLKTWAIFAGYQSGFGIESGALNVATNLIYIALDFINVVPILLFCSALRRNNRFGRRVALIIICFEIIQSFFTGTKAGPILQLIVFFIAYHMVVKPISTRKVWILLAVGSIAIIPFYILKSGVREAHTLYSSGDRVKMNLRDYGSLYDDTFSRVSGTNDTSYKDTLYGIINRSDTLSVLGSAMSYYETSREYDTKMYLVLWLKSFIPRFLWQDKGWAGIGLFLSNIILGIPYYTHTATTALIEGYVGGGVLGTLIIASIHAVFLGFTYAYLSGRGLNRDYSLGRAYLASITLTLSGFSQSYAFLRIVFMNLIFLWLLIKALAWWKAKKQKVRFNYTQIPSFLKQDKEK